MSATQILRNEDAPIRLKHAATLLVLANQGDWIYMGTDDGSGLQTWNCPTSMEVVRYWFPRR